MVHTLAVTTGLLVVGVNDAPAQQAVVLAGSFHHNHSYSLVVPDTMQDQMHLFLAAAAAAAVTQSSLPPLSVLLLPYLLLTGSALELAWQLVSLSKVLGARVLVSQYVYEAISMFEFDIVDFISPDPMVADGHTRTAVYELRGPRSKRQAGAERAEEVLYRQAFADFTHRRFALAREKFTEYLQRCVTASKWCLPVTIRYNPRQALRLLRLSMYYSGRPSGAPFARRLTWTPLEQEPRNLPVPKELSVLDTFYSSRGPAPIQVPVSNYC